MSLLLIHMYCIINDSSITQFLSMILVFIDFIHKYPMYMYSNTLYTVTMTHFICGINLSCCSFNQVLYSGCVTPPSSIHQSSGSTLHMRRVDQYNTHKLLTVSCFWILLGPTDETGTNPFTTQDCSVWVT